MKEPRRRDAFTRNMDLEQLLVELGNLLRPGEEIIEASLNRPRHPVVLIVGVARSGTTLLMQWLAQSGYFAYPSNLISRFFAAPYIGARIQQLLVDKKFSFRHELAGLSEQLNFSSDLGKTRGALSPNEFWYLWRRFIPTSELRPLTHEEEKRIDSVGLLKALAALEAAFDRPLVMKGLILQFNTPFLADLLGRVLFVWVRRHPLFTMQSLLEAREKYWGNRERWYSFRPAESAQLEDLDPFGQVAGQVLFTERALQASSQTTGSDRWLTVSYEEFCREPERIYAEIRDKLECLGYTADPTYWGPKSFTPTNRIRLKGDEIEKLLSAWKDLGGDDLETLGL